MERAYRLAKDRMMDCMRDHLPDENEKVTVPIGLSSFFRGDDIAPAA
jgi:hypothetical protein